MVKLSEYTVAELRKKTRQKGLSGYSKLRKSELVKLLAKPKKPSKKRRSKECQYGIKKDGGCKKKSGRKSQSRSRRKSTRKSRRRSRRKSKQTSSSGLKQVAFCFLLYDKIQHLKIWEDFFDQDHDGTSMIYSHVKKVTKETPEWIKRERVQTVPTSWCGEGITNAFNQMLKKSLKNKNNHYFILISGSDIPLYTYPESYKKIVSSDKSRIHYMKIRDNVFEDRADIYNAHNWVLLNREVAKQYIRLSDTKDRQARDFVKRFRQLYTDHGNPMNRGIIEKPIHDQGWIGSCPDEVYPINWLVEVYGKHTGTRFKKYISRSKPTYSSWDFEKDPDHPEIFNIRTVKKAKREICDHGYIFARKFTADAAKYIAMNCGKGYSSSSYSHKKTPVIVRKELVGRLGNQMFQYAASLGIAVRKHGDACIITDDDLISYDELRKENEDLISVCKGPFKICGSPDYDFTVIPEVGHTRYDIDRFLVPGSIEIETDMDQGFLQSYKYFDNIEGIIRKKFSFKGTISRKVNSYMKKIKSGRTKIVGIHVRRGDHIALGFMRFPPMKYFQKAKEHFRKKFDKVKFIVATNDRKWAQENFQDYDTDIIMHSKSGPEDLAILGACDGVIMSLGTFSWWGAWLCNGPVVYYKNEFVMSNPINKGKVRKSDYYPSKWVGLS
jgi:galactoside 2-L-fucosyltransferase 1/2